MSFVHIVSRDTVGGRNPLREFSTFKVFTATVRDRCEEQPTTVTLTEVGSYRFLHAAASGA